MKEDCVIWPETDRPLGIIQQKPQNDKRARRCYRCDPLGHVCQYAPGADLALIVGPSYSSMGPSGVLRTTRRGPIVSNLAPSGLIRLGALCLSMSTYVFCKGIDRPLRKTSRSPRRKRFKGRTSEIRTACLSMMPKRTLSLYPKKRIRCKNFAGSCLAPLKNKQQVKLKEPKACTEVLKKLDMKSVIGYPIGKPIDEKRSVDH